MKKLNTLSALCILSAMALFSCGEDHVIISQPTGGGEPIQISSVSYDGFTRVSESNQDSLKKNGFGVFCYVVGPDKYATYFEDTCKYEDNAWVFESGKQHLWPQSSDTTLNFFAVYAPGVYYYKSACFVGDYEEEGGEVEEYDCIRFDDEIPDTCDVMLDARLNRKPSGGGVILQFKHIMAEVEVGVSLRDDSLTNKYDRYSVEAVLEGSSLSNFIADEVGCYWNRNQEEGRSIQYTYLNDGDTPVENDRTLPTYTPLGEMKFVYPTTYSIVASCYGYATSSAGETHKELVNTFEGTVDLSAYMGKKVKLNVTANLKGDGNRPLDGLETSDDEIGTIDAVQIRECEWK